MATQWFVEALNIDSNEIIAQALQLTQIASEQIQMHDSRGLPHNLWQCDFSDIITLRGNTSGVLKFHTFKRNRNYGPVELAPGFAQQHKPKKRVDLHLVHFNTPPTRPAH